MTAVRAFGPGRVNLIGEHTDYNDGLCLPFAIAAGVTVEAADGPAGRIEAHALDLGETDAFAVGDPEPAEGWRAFVRGTVAELQRAGHALDGAVLRIRGDVPRGSGLSSSAALEVALALALLAHSGRAEPDRRDLARLCSRVENDWVGAQTGLLDQLAALFGREGHAIRLDMRTLAVDAVALDLRGWRLVTVDSGVEHAHAGSGYNARRRECAEAAAALGVDSLRDAAAGRRRPAARPARPARPPRARRERARRRGRRRARRGRPRGRSARSSTPRTRACATTTRSRCRRRRAPVRGSGAGAGGRAWSAAASAGRSSGCSRPARARRPTPVGRARRAAHGWYRPPPRVVRGGARPPPFPGHAPPPAPPRPHRPADRARRRAGRRLPRRARRAP